MDTPNCELLEIKQKDELRNIKSNYILKKVFDYLQKFKWYGLVKYNKKIQSRLNLSIIELRKYYEKYLQIEIEIIPLIGDKYNEKIQFINKSGEHYHIYFNDNIQEIKRNYFMGKEKVSKIKILIDYPVISLANLFSDCKYINSINFKKFNRKNINNMSYMFYGCSSLYRLNLSNFITNNVMNMTYMFSGCTSLTKLNFSNFNTNNVKHMSNMFRNCWQLTELNLSNFNTENVIDMSFMFIYCSKLKALNLSSFNINNVKNMSHMFYSCNSLEKINISNFNINKVKDKTDMFYGCNSLKDFNFYSK